MELPSTLIMLASCQQSCMTYTISVRTVENSWRRTEELSETCRVFNSRIKIWESSASSWFCCKEFSVCFLLHCACLIGLYRFIHLLQTLMCCFKCIHVKDTKIGKWQLYVNCISYRKIFLAKGLAHNGIYNLYTTGLFISPSGISELDCATTKTDTAERSISIGRESLQALFCTRGLGLLQGSTARG